MDPKEKKVKEEELNVEETLNNAEEQPQDEQAENAVPMTHEEELEKELETAQETIEEQKVIETKDQPLNTDYHEAIAVIPAPSEAQKGKILDCVQTGYTLNDKVLRHAKVVVGE